MNDQYTSMYGAGNASLSPSSTIQTKPKETFAKKEQILAFASMALGFLFVRFVCCHVTGLLTTVFFALLITFCILYLRRSKQTFTKNHKALAAVLYAFSLVYTITANRLLTFLCTVFLILTSALFVHAVCHPEGGVFRWLPCSLSKAVFSHPFGGFGKCPAAALSGIRQKSGWKNIGYVIGGLLITVPLTILVAALLCSADQGMDQLFNYLFFELFNHDELSAELLTLLPQICFGILIGFYIFGMLYSNAVKSCAPPLQERDCENTLLTLRFLPNPMVYAAVTPICILYVLFFASQFRYFLGGFTGDLSDGFTYAEYARRGFFELCGVCCINIAVIGIMSFCTRIGGAVKPMLLKIYTLFLAVCSLILAGTAIAKMCLYIANYGMTQLRIYTTWFMILLIMGFVLIIIRQFKLYFPVCKIGFALFTGMFALLCFSRPDAWMTRYNAHMYHAGVLAEFDYNHLASLSYDGLSAAVACSDMLDKDEISDLLARHSAACYRDKYELLNFSAWCIKANGGQSE